LYSFTGLRYHARRDNTPPFRRNISAARHKTSCYVNTRLRYFGRARDAWRYARYINTVYSLLISHALLSPLAYETLRPTTISLKRRDTSLLIRLNGTARCRHTHLSIHLPAEIRDASALPMDTTPTKFPPQAPHRTRRRRKITYSHWERFLYFDICYDKRSSLMIALYITTIFDIMRHYRSCFYCIYLCMLRNISYWMHHDNI
jgi:hypothetical protein